jgi:hypothetical protein
MTQPAQPRIAEGMIVLAAAALMAVGLGGVVWWQPALRNRAAETDPGGGADAAEAKWRQALAEAEQALASERSARETAETAARAAEDARIEAAARKELESEGYRRQVAALTAEKEQLSAEVRDLQSKVLQLVDALESESPPERAAATEAPAAVPAGPGPNEVSQRALNAARVVDANEPLRYVVLDVGSAQGVRPGMQFSVLEGDEVLAQLRVEDVRETLSGAVVELVPGARFPAPNDRAIVSRHVER